MKNCVLGASMFLLAGCQTLGGDAPIQPVRYYESPGRYIDAGPESYIVKMVDSFSEAAADARKYPSDHEKSKLFLASGMMITDVYCVEYFNSAQTQQQRRKFSRTAANDFGGLLTALLTIADASKVSIGGASSIFSFLDSGARNYDSAFLVSLDLADAFIIVRRVQNTLANNYLEAPNLNYPLAERALISYSSTCSFTGIQSIVKESIRTSGVGTEGRGVLSFYNINPDASKKNASLEGNANSAVSARGRVDTVKNSDTKQGD